MMRKNTWLLLSALVLVVVAVAYWRLTRPRTSTSPHLTVAIREGLEADGIARLATEFGTIKGASVRIERLGRENYEVNVATDLTSAHSAYDVVFLPGTLVAEMAQKGAIAPLAPTAADDVADFFDVVRYEGKIFALPTDVSTFYMVYRSDLVRKVPETWNDIVGQGGIALSGNAATYAFAFSCRPGEELPPMFYPFLWSAGGYLVDDKRVGLDGPEGIAAATMFRDLTRTKGFPKDFNTWEVGRILDEFQKGTLALSAPQWNAVYPILKKDARFGGSFSAATLPAFRRSDGSSHVTNYMRFWTLVKSARSAEPSLADGLIRYVTSTEACKRYAQEWSGTPARRSVLTSAEVRKIRPDFELLASSLKEAKTEPNVPYFARMNQILNDELSQLLSGRKTPADAMKSAASALRQLQ